MTEWYIWKSNFSLFIFVANTYINILKNYFFFFFLLSISIVSYGQHPVQDWVGVLNAGGQKIELRLHLIQNTDKTYTSNWDVPAQKAKGITSSKTDLSGNQLSIEIKMIGAWKRFLLKFGESFLLLGTTFFEDKLSLGKDLKLARSES